MHAKAAHAHHALLSLVPNQGAEKMESTGVLAEVLFLRMGSLPVLLELLSLVRKTDFCGMSRRQGKGLPARPVTQAG